MADTDMVFAADAADRLIAAADPVERPVVGGLCLQRDKDGGKPYPTMYELVAGRGGPGGVLPAAGSGRRTRWCGSTATGTGFLLMHRDALETVAKAAGTRRRRGSGRCRGRRRWRCWRRI